MSATCGWLTVDRIGGYGEVVRGDKVIAVLVDARIELGGKGWRRFARG